MIQIHTQKTWDPDQFAKRIANIITGLASDDPNHAPYFHPDRNTYQLDAGNNWFLQQLNENTWELRYRYNNSKPAQDALNAIKTLVEFLHGPH